MSIVYAQNTDFRKAGTMVADHTNTQAEALATRAQNHATLVSALHKGRHADAFDSERRSLELSLERMRYDRVANAPVPFDGECGIEAVLAKIAELWQGCAQDWSDGHLVGLVAKRPVGGTAVNVSISVGAGGQLVCTAGPTLRVTEFKDALDEFDRAIHVAASRLGCDYALAAEGYNPYASSPLDVSLVPCTKWTLLSAQLSQTGRYARDAMRCSYATQISLDYGNERDAITAYRTAVALTPLFMFLTDNVRSFRGCDARRCPRMVRATIWQEVDPARCGIVPGTFDEDFSFERYVSWLEGLLPVLYSDGSGTTISTGKRTLAEFMEGQVLTQRDVLQFYDIAFPFVRLGSRIELLQADALHPRLAMGYAAFVKGLFCNGLALDATRDLIGVVSEDDVQEAIRELRLRGWDAMVYGRRTGELVDKLIRIARSGLEDLGERRMLGELATLWEVRMVPRDAFVQQEIKARRGW